MADGSPLKATGQAYYERASPSLLARQPNSIPTPPYNPNRDWPVLLQHLQARLGMLRNWRLSWIEHWALLSEFILPRRNTWLAEGARNQPVPNSMMRGLPINQSIVDPTGTQAMRICSAGMMSGLTSPSRPWFKLKAGMGIRGQLLDHAAKVWFEAVEEVLYAVMGASNFYDSLTQHWEDLVVYGTAPIIIYEDEQDIIRCYNPCAGEYYLAVDNTLRVESLYRMYVMTVSQIVGMFGLENCPTDVQSMWQTKGGAIETERLVAHAIEPNYEVDDTGAGIIKGDFAYREVYWLWGAGADKPLSMKGFKDCPFIAPRWATTSNDPYGRSPGMDTLPDIMQLQVETKRKAEAIEKQVRPPLLASVELKNEPSSILPGHVTYVSQLSPDKGMRPIYTVNPEIREMMMDIKEVQIRVKGGFFNDLFLMLAQMTKDMTAYEVAQRQQEKLQVLGPVIERFQNEGAAPAIKRIFSICMRKKLFPPIPASLAGVPITIDFISMLTLAQRAASTAAIERVEGMMARVGAVDPSIFDAVDQDVLIMEYGEQLTAPAKIFRTPEQIAEMREQRAKLKQQQAALSQTLAAVKGAQVMSQTDVGGGQNALSSMLGSTGGMGAQ